MSNDWGVCDLIFTTGSSRVHLSQNTEDCEQGDDGVMQIDMMMTTEVPLVGFYGKVDEFNIIELGLILADKFTPQCLTSIHDNGEIQSKIDKMGA